MRLLLIEDEEGFAEALCASLKMEHYITDWAKDGEEGLNLGLSGVYDAIILDIMLPKMNGLTVLRKLRQQDIHTPVLLLTAKSELEDKMVWTQVPTITSQNHFTERNSMQDFGH